MRCMQFFKNFAEVFSKILLEPNAACDGHVGFNNEFTVVQEKVLCQFIVTCPWSQGYSHLFL